MNNYDEFNEHNYKLLKILKNKHVGKDCLIITCGPSFKEFSKETIKNFMKDKIVICVKEAVLEYIDDCDYFIMNPWRDREYPQFNKKTIKISNWDIGRVRVKNDIDIWIPHMPNPFFKQNPLIKTHDFETYNFDNKFHRAWGPGVMIETVFYLCQYMGLKNIYTIGWDQSTNNGNVEHYFEHSDEDKYKKSIRVVGNNYTNELELMNENINYLYDYFKKYNMNIIVCGKQSEVNTYIPRIDL